MTIRRRVKTSRAADGRHRYLIIAGNLPILVSKSRYRTVGAAKSAGKAKARLLGPVTGPLHIQIRGLCIDCLYHGVARQADKPGVLCRSCHQQRHPAKVARSGVA